MSDKVFENLIRLGGLAFLISFLTILKLI